METYEIRVRGTAPVLMHNPASMLDGDGGAAKRKQQYCPEEDAEKATYRNEDGYLCLPTIAFRAAMLRGASGLKVGKVTLKSILGHVRPADELTVLVNPETGEPITSYALDTRRAVVQKNGILRTRPRVDQWACTVRLIGDPDISPNLEELIKTALYHAGNLVGVGDYRVEKGGWFGTFEVEA